MAVWHDMAEVKPSRPKKSLFYSCLTTACEGRRLASGFLLEVWKTFVDTCFRKFHLRLGSFCVRWSCGRCGAAAYHNMRKLLAQEV